MPLPQDFDKTVAEKTDEQLYDMLTHADDYLPEALTAARAEIQRRDLAPTRVAQLETQSETIRTQELRVADEPLSWPVRIVMALLSFGMLQVIVSDAYQSKGYTRKHQECWTWMKYGMGFWVVFFILLFVAPFSDYFWVGLCIVAAISVAVVTFIVWIFRRAKRPSQTGSK